MPAGEASGRGLDFLTSTALAAEPPAVGPHVSIALAIVLAVAVPAGSASPATPPPDFAAYPGEPVLAEAPATPELSNRRARRFRTVLREGAAAGPNFDGHYRVVSWGCGSNCLEWAIVDLVNGHVWFATKPALSCMGDEPRQARVPGWLETRVDSRLLALHECTDPGKRLTFDQRKLYEWRAGSLHFVRRERLW